MHSNLVCALHTQANNRVEIFTFHTNFEHPDLIRSQFAILPLDSKRITCTTPHTKYRMQQTPFQKLTFP